MNLKHLFTIIVLIALSSITFLFANTINNQEKLPQKGNDFIKINKYNKASVVSPSSDFT